MTGLGKQFGVVAVACSLAALAFTALPGIRDAVPPPAQTGATEFKPLATIPPDDPRWAVIARVNVKNRAVASVRADTLEVKTKYRFVSPDGTLAYEKPNRFRLTLATRFGKEIDLGATPDAVWFSSRQYHDGRQYFCPTADLARSKLKAPFNPAWMTASLGFDEIEVRGATLFDRNGSIGVAREVLDVRGNPLRLVTIIDPRTDRVTGCYLSDAQDRRIASTEVLKYDAAGRPKRWAVDWTVEGTSLEIELIDPVFNSPIPAARWARPAGPTDVDMSKD